MANFWGKLMSAVRAGVAVYNQKQLSPREEWGWDSYAARLARYWLYQSYADNTVYSSIEAFAATLKNTNRLYRNIRGVYNPVARQNRLIVSNVYKGSIDMEHLSGGALPVVAGNPALIEPLIQIIKWSSLTQQLSLYVHLAALLGDVGLWLVDDRQRQRIRVEVLHPGKIKAVELDEVGNVKAAVIEYEREEEEDVRGIRASRFSLSGVPHSPRKSYTFTLKVDQQWFETFRDGEPFAYYLDADGQPIKRWANEYGFVPLKLAHYDSRDLRWGVNAFYNALRKIDEINDQASLLNDSIRNTVVPLLKARGVASQEQMTVATDEKTGLKVLYLSSPDSDIEALAAQINIADASTNIGNMLLELERDMPELALQRIREGGNLTAPGVRTGYSDAIGNIENARKNLDTPLMGALLMGITMAAVSGYDGFGAFDGESFDRGDMEAYIRDRAVISDTLSLQEKLTNLGAVADKPPAIQRLMLKEIGYSDAEIEEVIASAELQQQQQTRDAVRALTDQVFGTDQTDQGDGVNDGQTATEPDPETAAP